MEKEIIRQGDVMLTKVAKVPKNSVKKEPENGKHILAYGEVTGHHHRFQESEGVECFVSNDNNRERRFYVVETKAFLRHEEHTEIELGKGIWEQIYQYEVTDEDDPVPVRD